MDLGLTTRGYEHSFPINGGIFYIRVNNNMKLWVNWHRKEIYRPIWEPYVQHRKRWNHAHYGFDWSVGQDFLVANWIKRQEVKAEKDVNIIDVGPEFNYCPPTDTMGDKAFKMAWDALINESITTLHLKSELKQMIYQPGFPGAHIKHPRGRLAWL